MRAAQAAVVIQILIVASCDKKSSSTATDIKSDATFPPQALASALQLTPQSPVGATRAATPFPSFQTEASATKAAGRTLECDQASPTAAGRPRITCSVSDVLVSKETPHPTSSADLAKIKSDTQADIAKKGDAFWRECSKEFAIADPSAAASAPEYQRNDVTRLQNACAKKDADAMIAAMVAAITDSDDASAQTCKVSSTAYRAIFEQIDRDTWQETRGPEGACHVSSITTLTRDPAFPTQWNYRAVTTVPNATGPLCSAMKPVDVDEMRWSPNPTLDMNCRYITFSL